MFRLVAETACGESGPTRLGGAPGRSAPADDRRRRSISAGCAGALLLFLVVLPAASLAGCDAESVLFLDDDAGSGISLPQLDGVAPSGLGPALAPPEARGLVRRPASGTPRPLHDPLPSLLLRAPPRR